jgi:hypothetical protein
MAFAKDVIILIVSIGIGLFLAGNIAQIGTIGEGTIPFYLWGIFTVIITISLRRLFNHGIKIGRSSWGPPEQQRDRVVSSPQFVGRLDRKSGLLESTARMVSEDIVNQPSYWSQTGEDYNLIRLRGELLDQNGSPLEYIPIEIRAKRKDWVGTIVDGDRIRVEGGFGSDGILHAEWSFNYSTNSRVGKRN